MAIKRIRSARARRGNDSGCFRVGGHYPLPMLYHSTPPSVDEDASSDPPSLEVTADDMTTETDDSGFSSSSAKKELIPGQFW